MAIPLYNVYEGGRLASADVVLSGVVPAAEIAERLEGLSESLGAIACSVYENIEEDSTTLHFANYPRAKYGERNARDIMRTAEGTAAELRGFVVPFDLSQITKPPQSTAVIGRRQGYGGTEIFNAQEMHETIASGSKGTVNSDEISVISVAPGAIYTEPALAVSFSRKPTLTKIIKAADQYGQERFSIELPRHMRIFMVETPNCTEPDSNTPSVRRTAGGVAGYVFRPRYLSSIY